MRDGRKVVVDLFCGAGGMTAGYRRAMPEALFIGVDVNPQPNYPGDEFIQADAMTFDLSEADFVSASPPCQDHSTVSGASRKANGAHGTGWMLEATADRLRQLNVPWVIENVSFAKMPEARCQIMLCGSSFGLDLRRHRKFISSHDLVAPPCDHGWQTPRFLSLDFRMRKAGNLASVIGVHGSTQYKGDFANRCRAMGIDWMTNAELSQAIPPVYAELIGNQLKEHI